MKNIITLAVLFISLTMFAQVGINNTSPKATLDISPKTTDGSKPEGLLIPQLDGNSLKTASYGTSQKGVIVYAKSAASPTDAKTVNVTAEGYYYFDGSVWQKMTGAAAGDTTNDPWVNDTTNGLVKLGTKADGTARAAGTDIVAKDDGSVGIGITTPAGKLDVNGNMILRNSAVSGGTVNLSIRSTNGTNRWGIGMDNVETGSGNTGGDLKIWNYADDGGYISSPVTIKRSSGNVGIGTISPANQLHISATSDPLRLDGLQAGTKTMNYLVTDTNGVIKTVTPESTNPSNVYVFVKMANDQSVTYSSNSFANTLVPFDTKVTDTNNAYNLSTQTFTAPENGYYLINQVLSMNFDCTGASNTYVYSIVNAAGNRFQAGSYSSDTNISYEGGSAVQSVVAYLTTGQTAKFYYVVITGGTPGSGSFKFSGENSTLCAHSNMGLSNYLTITKL